MEFCLQADNKSLAWLLQHTKELGHIGQCILHLALFKFKVCHASGKTNMVADCLTRHCEDLSVNATFTRFVLQHLPKTFQLIQNTKRKTLSAKTSI
jgi:hypothetical protein